MKLSPIAIFAFNRPEYLERLLTSLQRNREFLDSPTFLFIDGSRNHTENKKVLEVEAIARSKEWARNLQIIKSDSNRGLSKSLMAGIDLVLNLYDRIIVLEDDLIVGETFLEYCNRGLDLYELFPNVASIQGYTVDVHYTARDTYFLRGADCWGWATWKNRWVEMTRDGSQLLSRLSDAKLQTEFDLDGAYPYTQMLRRQADGKLDSWAIRWHASMFLQNRVSLYPRRTLVENLGQDGSGTHSGSKKFEPRELVFFRPELSEIQVAETKKVRKEIKRVLRKKYGTYSLKDPRKYFNFLCRKILNAAQ